MRTLLSLRSTSVMASLFERDIVGREQLVTLRRQNCTERIQCSRDEKFREPKISCKWNLFWRGMKIWRGSFPCFRRQLQAIDLASNILIAGTALIQPIALAWLPLTDAY